MISPSPGSQYREKVGVGLLEDVLILLGGAALAVIPKRCGEGARQEKRHTELLLRANPPTASSQNNLPWGLWVLGPVALAAAFQGAPKC